MYSVRNSLSNLVRLKGGRAPCVREEESRVGATAGARRRAELACEDGDGAQAEAGARASHRTGTRPPGARQRRRRRAHPLQTALRRTSGSLIADSDIVQKYSTISTDTIFIYVHIPMYNTHTIIRRWQI